MLFSDFKKISLYEWTRYLRFVYDSQTKGKISPRELIILFPKVMICSETPDHFIMELLGISNTFFPLTLKSHSIGSTNEYFNQFPVRKDKNIPALDLNGKQYLNFQDLVFSNEITLGESNPRLALVNINKQKYPIIMFGGNGGAINVPAETNFINFLNTVLINRYSSAIRTKLILQLILIRQSTSINDYLAYLHSTFDKNDRIYGILHCKQKEEIKYLMAGQFINTFLFPGLRETSIGDFLNKHPDFIKKAFSTKVFVYEPYLEWIYKRKCDNEKPINPDLLVQREDGNYDIYDLKTAMLTKNKVTKGKRRRRRFIDYIEEGVAQLAHYEEYFLYEQNKRHAFEKYGIKIKDPRLFLVAGNLENVNKEKVDEACRRLRNFTLIDYDSILSMYLMTI